MKIFCPLRSIRVNLTGCYIIYTHGGSVACRHSVRKCSSQTHGSLPILIHKPFWNTTMRQLVVTHAAQGEWVTQGTMSRIQWEKQLFRDMEVRKTFDGRYKVNLILKTSRPGWRRNGSINDNNMGYCAWKEVVHRLRAKGITWNSSARVATAPEEKLSGTNQNLNTLFHVLPEPMWQL